MVSALNPTLKRGEMGFSLMTERYHYIQEQDGSERVYDLVLDPDASHPLDTERLSPVLAPFRDAIRRMRGCEKTPARRTPACEPGDIL
jgi:hypothetical protein